MLFSNSIRSGLRSFLGIQIPTPHSAPPADTAVNRMKARKEKLLEAKALRYEGTLDILGSLAPPRPAGQPISHELNESYLAADGYMAQWVDLLDRYRDGFAPTYPLTTAQDRQYGSNWPFWISQQQLSILRAQGRMIHTVMSNAIGLLDGMKSYVVHKGNTYTATAKKNKSKSKTAEKVQEIIDTFVKRNNYGAVEGEFFIRSRRDGESFLRMYNDGGDVSVRFVEPDQIFQPPGKSMEEWSYGMRHEPGDICKILAYAVFYTLKGRKSKGSIELGNVSEFDEVPAEEIVHYKANVDDNVKRGLTDFAYDSFDMLNIASKIRRAVGEGSVVQASIAQIRQHADGVDPESVAEFVRTENEIVTNTGNGQGGITQVPSTKVYPGMALDIPANYNYIEPPGAANAVNHSAIAQMLVRNAGARHNAPEWLGTSDASNGNYSSSLVAESPFVRTCECHQEVYGRCHIRVIEYVIDAKAKLGDIPEDWRNEVELKVDHPRVTSRDRQADAAENETYNQLGIKSPQTISQELNLDYDQEQANFDEVKEKQAKDANENGDEEQEGSEVGESILEQLLMEIEDDEGHMHSEKDGKFTSKRGGKARKQPKPSIDTPTEIVRSIDTPAGQYRFSARSNKHEGDSWYVNFSLKEKFGGYESGATGAAGGGKAIAVFREIGLAMDEFVADKKPKKFHFTGSDKEKGRVKLYDHISKILAKKYGYKLDRKKVTEPYPVTFYQFTKSGGVSESASFIELFNRPAFDKKALIVLLETGFTGTVRDKLGRAFTFRNGDRVIRKAKKNIGELLEDEMKQVASSNVDKIGFDKTTKELKVKFKRKDGGAAPTYRYPGSTGHEFGGFQRAQSKGKWVWRKLRRPGRSFTKGME